MSISIRHHSKGRDPQREIKKNLSGTFVKPFRQKLSVAPLALDCFQVFSALIKVGYFAKNDHKTSKIADVSQFL